MKNILICDEELPGGEFPVEPDSILRKRNKTIFKDPNPQLLQFIKNKFPTAKYKFYLEDWEFCTQDGFQIVVNPQGLPMRPVHVVSSNKPSYGFKALFQVESLIVFSYHQGRFILKRAKVDVGSGARKQQFIAKGKGDNIDLINSQIPNEQMQGIVKTAWEAWEKIRNSKVYSDPIFAKQDSIEQPTV